MCLVMQVCGCQGLTHACLDATQPLFYTPTFSRAKFRSAFQAGLLVLAQVVGAIIGDLLVRASIPTLLQGGSVSTGVPQLKYGSTNLSALTLEALCTFFLVFIIFSKSFGYLVCSFGPSIVCLLTPFCLYHSESERRGHSFKEPEEKGERHRAAGFVQRRRDGCGARACLDHDCCVSLHGRVLQPGSRLCRIPLRALTPFIVLDSSPGSIYRRGGSGARKPALRAGAHWCRDEKRLIFHHPVVRCPKNVPNKTLCSLMHRLSSVSLLPLPSLVPLHGLRINLRAHLS